MPSLISLGSIIFGVALVFFFAGLDVGLTRQQSSEHSDQIRNIGALSADARHRAFERECWMWSFRLSVLVAVGAFIAAYENYRQADAAQKQLALTIPSNLAVFAIQMWEKEKGKAFDNNNPLPPHENRKNLEGVVYVANKGVGKATVVASSLIGRWKAEPINMTDPIWKFDAQTDNRLKGVDGGSDYRPRDVSPVHDIDPGALNMWGFSTTTEGLPKGNFYIFGRVVYEDQNGIQHDLAFTRRYDFDKGRFVRPDDANEDVENETSEALPRQAALVDHTAMQSP